MNWLLAICFGCFVVWFARYQYRETWPDMKRLAFWLSWLCAVAAFRLAHYAKDGVGEADEYKAGGTD